MAGQVRHARRALRVIHSFESARKERLSLTGSTSDLGEETDQSAAGLAGVSPILEHAAVGDYPAAVVESNTHSRGFAAPTDPVKGSLSDAVEPAVIGQIWLLLGPSNGGPPRNNECLLKIWEHGCSCPKDRCSGRLQRGWVNGVFTR